MPYLLGIEIPFPLVQGPFLYLYTASLTNRKLGKIELLHFAPIAIGYLFLIPFFGIPSSEKITVYENSGLGYEGLMTVFYALILASGIIYPFLAFLKLLKHERNIINQFTYTETINLAWLRYLIIGTSIIWLVVILGNDEQIFSTVVAYIFFIGYFGIKQVGIFTNKVPTVDALVPNKDIEKNSPISSISDSDNEVPADQPSKIKYEKSGLKLEDLQAIHIKLKLLMLQEKLYKNPELTLAEISQKLSVHPNVLSQVINSIEQKNLYDYVNQQRVDEFKRLVLLPENQKFTLLSLAYECGYNSKTAFNRNFKKETGLSPTAYLKQADIGLL